ncbi:MAG: Smr/MutS family protein [Bryobacterales bacterium]|nr:Smr/MutS family protein [Bryobacterales bacterium]MBV9399707.1 Smr/MutS family protein [Bryobacterales bacterium]
MHSEPVLEFDDLRELLGRYVRSPLGRTGLAQIAPVSDRTTIEAALADTAEAIEYLRTSSQPQPAARGAAVRLRFDFGGDPAPAVARLRIEGATLDGAEILDLTRLLDLAAEARALILGAREKFPRLAAHASAMADLHEIAAQLRNKILPDGALADDASPLLARLRRDTEKQRRLIEESLDRFLRLHQEDRTLQENFVTIRNDRFVVPVVTGREKRVDGVIHGSSGSGHTVFVEPLETIHLNNELVQLREEELREVHRLLREFTARLRDHAPAIAETVAALGRLELLFAKADFAADFGCIVPRLSPDTERRVILREARHPLLEDILRRQGKRVVPVSLSLSGGTRTLLISGPNTGGKTVALKTAGLLALMTHAGLPAPAAEAEFPLFDRVLADIGDHQSIQESLSSFSAHIMAIRSMLENATSDSLVLLDELGRATDPEEGGALGVVILEAFRSRAAFTLASTHLQAMKMYGATTEGVLNGSMGFDEATLEPTYVLRLGAPGKSAGLDIATRLGLDRAVIKAARERMSHSERDIAQFLSRLEAQLHAVEEERATLAGRERDIAAKEHSLEQTWERKYAAKVRELEDRAGELASQFEQRAQNAIQELSQRAMSNKAQAKIAKTTREYQDAVAALSPPSPSPARPTRLTIADGARVRLKGIRQPATVRRITGDDIEVDAGFLKMRVPISDVEEVLPPSDKPMRASGISFQQRPSFEGSFREINLIGQRAEEACDRIEKFLDTAALAQVERVRIIHGHGMGILKRAVADLLKHNPHVAKYYLAPPEEGGSGATIVELK